MYCLHSIRSPILGSILTGSLLITVFRLPSKVTSIAISALKLDFLLIAKCRAPPSESLGAVNSVDLTGISLFVR